VRIEQELSAPLLQQQINSGNEGLLEEDEESKRQ
jgi:hypothetical protein